MQLGIKVDAQPDGKYLQKYGGYLAATAIHMGSYDSMISTHLKLFTWIHQNGYEPYGSLAEEFVISPIECTDQNEQIAKIIIPIRKKKKAEQGVLT